MTVREILKLGVKSVYINTDSGMVQIGYLEISSDGKKIIFTEAT